MLMVVHSLTQSLSLSFDFLEETSQWTLSPSSLDAYLEKRNIQRLLPQ